MAQNEVVVWDPVVRFGHWIVVAAFAVAYLTEEDLLSTHVWAGYVVGLVVAFRVAWGFVGPARARFSDFVYGPATVANYLIDLARFCAKRYLGHSPAGGAMVLALLLSLAATVITGLATYGADKKAGPLAPLYAADASAPVVSGVRPAVAKEDRERNAVGDEAESATKELHEFVANVTLVLILLHVVGVGFASIAHRENLVRAMITGRKRIEPSAASASERSAAASDARPRSSR